MRLPLLLCLPALLLLAATPAFAANTAPTPVILRAEMRPGTTIMDIDYRVDDPDDATVRVRALAFVNGTRSFANILRPVTFVEGTARNLGDSILSGTKQTLAWNVGADWNTDLGQVKFEILALDSRGLLPIDWITIPAANGQPALTISKDTPSDAAVLNALFWLYADNDPGLLIANGVLYATAQSGVFAGVQLANGSTIQSYGRPFCFKRMNVDFATYQEVSYAANTARAGLLSTTTWHAANRPWQGISVILEWGGGGNGSGQSTIPIEVLSTAVTAIAASDTHCLALRSNGTVFAWGSNNWAGQMNMPSDLTNVTAIAAGGAQSIALKSEGTVVAWGFNPTVPHGLTGVVAIAAGLNHNLALKSDGTVVAWGSDWFDQTNVPTNLSSVTAIAAGMYHSLALKSNGTVVAWGDNGNGQLNIPKGLTGVTAIAAGVAHSIAVKSDGTVVAWGETATAPPTGLASVVAVAAGRYNNFALKSDGTIVEWPMQILWEFDNPNSLSGVTSIITNDFHVLALKAKAL